MYWLVELGGQEYATPMWPLFVTALGLLLVLPAGAWAFAVTRRWSWGWNGWRVFGAVVVVLLPLLLGIALCVVWIAAVGGQASSAGSDPDCTGADLVPAWHVFTRLIVIESAMALLTLVISSVIGVVWLGQEPSPGERGRAAPPLAVLGLCTLLALGSIAHGVWLTTYGGLPTLELEGPGYVHQDLAASWEMTPRTCLVPEGWSYPEPTPLPTDVRGTVEHTTTASSRWFEVRRDVQMRVGREQGSPVFPLRVGNRWVYDVHRTSSGRAMFGLLSLRRGPAESTVTLEVSGTEIRNGLRLFTMRITNGRSSEEMHLFAYEGRVIGLPGRRPWYVLRTAPEPGGYARPVTSPQHEGRYGFMLLGASCSGFSGGPEGPLGPAECHRGAAGYNFMLGFFSTVMTGGLFTLTGGASMQARLRDSSFGPAHAEAVAP